PSEMPQRGMKGKGMMMDGKMGPGMMGKGMMKGGMMGRMRQGGMMGRSCPMMGSGDGETHASGRIAFIKAELGITDNQKAVFDAYAGALKQNLQDMHAMRTRMMAGMKSGTPVEQLSARIQMMEGRLDTLKGVKPALDKLYAALSNEQKKKANKILTGMGCMM
ncbi:MAG: Spy/CpxP family protein refolding chaperone, partial [Alphaproteobacteria bacterium]|nr:Spy/CpxP family protein refolding chaperone [Alphaproteobacteria bacterium]